MKKNSPILLIGLFLLISLISCKRESELDNLEELQWKPLLAAPVFFSHLSIQEILDKPGGNDYITTDSSNLIYLTYNSRQQSKKGEDFLKLPNFSHTIMDTLLTIALITPQNEQLDSIHIKEGFFSYALLPDSTEDLQLSLLLPNVTESGMPLSLDLFLPAQPGQPSVQSDFLSLSNYAIDLSLNGSTHNSIQMEYLVKRAKDGVDVTGQFPMEVSFSGVLFDYLEGDFGLPVFQLQKDSVELAVFKNWKKGVIWFEDPRLTVDIRNSYGFPFQVQFITLQGTTEEEVFPINSPDIQPYFSINYPAPGMVENTQVALDRSNSNLSNFLAIRPKSLSYALLLSGEKDNDPSRINFMSDTSQVEIELELVLPMHGRIDGMVLLDTFDFDLPTEDLLESIESIEFRLETENKLPLNASIQIYFSGDNLNPIDSLFLPGEEILLSGNIDASQLVVQPSSKVTKVNYGPERSSKLKDASKVVLKATLYTLNNGKTPIKLYSDYYLDVRFGALIQKK